MGLELTWTDNSTGSRKKAYVGWAGEASGHREVLEISSHFAACLELQEGQQVTVRPANDIPTATMVNVEPFGADDWEIMELHHQYLEEQLLNQVKILYEGQKIAIWVHGQAVVHLRVTQTSPQKCVRLEQQSEVVVAAKPRPAANPNAPSKATQLRLLKVTTIDNHPNPFFIYVNPQDMEHFTWTSAGIVEVTRPVNKPVPSYARVYPLASVPHNFVAVSRSFRWCHSLLVNSRIWYVVGC